MGRIAIMLLVTNAFILCILGVAAADGASDSTSWTNWATKLTMPGTTANDVIDTREVWDSVKTVVKVKTDDLSAREMHVLRYKDPLDEEAEAIRRNKTYPVDDASVKEYREKSPLGEDTENKKRLENDGQTIQDTGVNAKVNDQMQKNEKWIGFAVTNSKSCSESLVVEAKPVHWSETIGAHVNSEMHDFEHDEWKQVVFDNHIEKFQIIYHFLSGPKTLKQRFIDASTIGERVHWTVRNGESDLIEEFNGTYWYAKGGKVTWEAKEGSKSTFSDDDGIFGAAAGDVDGNSEDNCLRNRKTQSRYGVENCNGIDQQQCGIYYMGSTRSIISDHVRNVMFANNYKYEGSSEENDKPRRLDDTSVALTRRRLASSYCNFYRISSTSGRASGGTSITVYGSNFNTGSSSYRCRFKSSRGTAYSAYVRPSSSKRLTCKTPHVKFGVYGYGTTVTIWDSSTECSYVDARSCNHMRRSAGHLRDGRYELANGKEVYCDMDNDGGGWMMAVQIDGNDEDHSNTGSVGASVVTPSTSYTSKYSDSEIRSFVGSSLIGSHAQIKFICAGRHHYYKGCSFRATRSAGGNWASCVTNYHNYYANSVRNAQSCNCGSQALGAHCSSRWYNSMTYCSHCDRGECAGGHNRKGCGHDQYGYSQRGSVWVRGGYVGSTYSRTFTFSSSYHAISRTSGYANGAHSITVTGYGFDTGRSDYRCRFRDSAGNSAYSANVRPSSSTSVTCRTPSWSWAATGKPTTVYLYERTSVSIQWTGSSRTFTFIPVYASLSRSSGSADGAYSFTVYGNGFNTGNSNYRCRFYSSKGNQAYSSTVRPSSSTQVTCRSPAWQFSATGNPTTVYLQESNKDLTFTGSRRTWTYYPSFQSISSSSGYADGRNSLTINGYGFDTGRSDYRCRWYASNGNQVYSAYVRPSTDNKFTCKVPVWNYRSYNYPTTVYAYESSTSITWRGSARAYTFIPTYKSISRTSGYANGASSITVTGNGFDTGRTDYRCRFRASNGNQAYSANVRPSSATSVTCRTPVWNYAATDYPTTVYLMHYSNTDVSWAGSKRTWTYIVVYSSLSRSTGSADGAYSVSISGNGFNTGRSDYRCKFTASNGNVAYSANIKPTSSTSLTCRTPVWNYAATSNPTTVQLLEKSNNGVTFVGSARTWTYYPSYKSLDRSSGYADGTHSVKITGNGFDTSRTDYRCRFRDGSGRQAYSANVRPSSATSITCRSPVWNYFATGNSLTVYLMERSNNDVSWRGSARAWSYIVTYKAISRNNGFADGTHSVTVSGNGFDTSRNDYRCRFRDGSGRQAYSASVRPSSSTQMTCRSPQWYFASTDNPVTLYLMERSNNDVTWRGTNRVWTYQVVYVTVTPKISSARGGKVITVRGYGMDVNRNDYVCIFRNNAGYERHSVAVKPDHGSDLRCVTPSFGSTLTLTNLILQENKRDVLWRGSDTWHRVFNFARPFYFGFNRQSQIEVAYYYNNVESKNQMLDTFGGQKKTQSVSISASFDSTVYILSKNPNKITTIDTMTSQVQFVSPQMSCTSSSCTSSMSISAMECDPRGKLFGVISNNKQLKFAEINPISGKVTVKKDLSLSGISHGVSATIDYNMIVIERPSNYLWAINMLDSNARRWYAKPSNLIIHSLEDVGENYLSGTAFDESISQERIVYFRYDSSSTSKSNHVGGGVRQGVSAYDQEAKKFIHHIYSNSKDTIKMVEFDVVGRRRRLNDYNDNEAAQMISDENDVESGMGELENVDTNFSNFGNHTADTPKGRRLGYVKVASVAVETHNVPTSVKPTFVEYSHGWNTCVHPYYYSCNSCETISSSLNRASRIWGKSTCDAEYNKGSNAASGQWGKLGCQSWWNGGRRSSTPCTTTST